MKSLNQLVKLSSAICLIGWILLIVLPYWQYTDKLVVSAVVALLCGIYTYLLFVHKNIKGERYPRGNFWTLAGVVNLFKNPRAVLAGWVHYLAFDLMVGLYIKNDALAHGINFWFIIPCLLLTLMFGPAGLLAYFLLKLLFVL